MPMSKKTIRGILEKNTDKEFVRRVLKPEGHQTIKNPDGSESSHSMASGDSKVYPTVIKDKRMNHMYRLSGKAAARYAGTTGENIKFKTDEEAQDFGKHYKKVWEK